MNMSERVAVLEQYIAEGRVIRRAWRGTTADGRETACLLVSLAPEAYADVRECPSDVMPEWLAHLTPWMDDSGSLDAWPAMVRRYAGLAARWSALTPEDWRRLEYTVHAVILTEALRHVSDDGQRAIAEVIALCRRAETGDRTVRLERVDTIRTQSEPAANILRGVASPVAEAAMMAAKRVMIPVMAAAAAPSSSDLVTNARDRAAELAADRITAGIMAAIDSAIDARDAPG